MYFFIGNFVRSRRPEVLCKKGVLRNFTEFTGKHLHQSLFFNKVAGLRLGTLFKKRPWNRCFPVNFVKFLRKPSLIEHLLELFENNDFADQVLSKFLIITRDLEGRVSNYHLLSHGMKKLS